MEKTNNVNLESNRNYNLDKLLKFCEGNNYPEHITTNILDDYLMFLENYKEDSYLPPLNTYKELVDYGYPDIVNKKVPVEVNWCPNLSPRMIYPETREEIVRKIKKLEKELNIN